MSHRLLTAAAAKLGVAAAAPPPAAAPTALVVPPATTAAAPAAPAAPGTAAAPAAAAEPEVVQDVVLVSEAQQAVVSAEGRGAETERARTNAVFASAEGKANPSLAAFMLNANPTASAESIVAHMKANPVTAAAPAAPAAAAPPVTHDLSQTPKIEAGVVPNEGGAEKASVEDQNKFWDTHMSSAAANVGGSPFGAELAPGLPRTGN